MFYKLPVEYTSALSSTRVVAYTTGKKGPIEVESQSKHFLRGCEEGIFIRSEKSVINFLGN